ncbi:MAG TPA: DUF4412 domain-containing protein [Gammaproteobacteria bacterium]|nr:DUF4412 domain-containing protein [Gammaproteobacteria bacterium]
MLKITPYAILLVTLAGYSTMPGHAIAAAPMNAGVGVHISFVDQAGKAASQLYVLHGKVRIESGDAQGSGAIYDASSHSMTVLIPERHAYMVLDQQSAAEMGATIQDAQKQMQTQLANLTPQQRAMVEQMMAKTSMAGGAAKPEVKDLGSSETVAGHRCRDIQIVTAGKPGLRMCVAPLSELGLPAGDMATLKTMRSDMTRLMAGLGPMAQTYSTMANVRGFAIKREVPHREGFKLVTGTEILQSASTGNPPASLFEIPAGYKQTSMKEMMQGGA